MPKVVKWGKNLAVRIPASVARALDWEVGDDIDIRVADNVERISSPDLEAFRERIRPLSAEFPKGWKIG